MVEWLHPSTTAAAPERGSRRWRRSITGPPIDPVDRFRDLPLPAWESRGDYRDIRMDVADGHRQAHHLPPRGPQRLPAPDPVRAERRLQRGPGRPVGRGRRPDRAGARRLLLGRRPEDPGRRRLHRRRRRGPAGDRPAQRARPPDPDPPAAEAGGGHGGRLRHRRRPHPPPGVRPDRSPPTTPGSARPARRWAASTAATAPACWPGRSG